MHGLAPIHNSKRTRTSPECNEIPILKWPGNLPEMNSIENIWNIMTKDIGNHMPSLKEEMWKRVCEVWYSLVLNVLEELNSSMPRRISDLIKQMEVQ